MRLSSTRLLLNVRNLPSESRGLVFLFALLHVTPWNSGRSMCSARAGLLPTTFLVPRPWASNHLVCRFAIVCVI